ncbi:MAG: flagellar hook protein FlgE [Ignavibacteriales bacterium]|nr:flagellar hook protein FlgE [Ignavibacteriales bacterium]
MAFLRSLFSGVSVLRNHQVMMDVIGNNISNVNTIGFKSSRATFGELFAQTLRGATQPIGTNGGANPIQIGLGMSVNTLDTNFNQGNIETTGQSTDLAIQGNGFFVVQKNGKISYTRVGTFALDANGRMVHPGNGAVLQGKVADDAGVIPAGTKLQDIKIALDKKSPAKATTSVKFAGNLDSSAATGDATSASVTVYDSLGNPITLSMTFTKTANPNEWSWAADVPTPATITGGGTGAITFNPDGTLKTFTYAAGTAVAVNPANGASALSVKLDVGTANVFAGITQSKALSNVSPREQDGYASGILSNISIDQNGQILGAFSNGTILTLGQVMLAEFNNPSGLTKSGENLYEVSGNSGIATIVSAGQSTASVIVAGALEQSNVDLADEFTKMIMAQRGFQSNARVITASDEFLNEVVNLKR